jgi:hypothetical protein
MFAGLLSLYLPYAVFYHCEKNVDLPLLYPTRSSKIGIAFLIIVVPILGNTIKFMINMELPVEISYQYSEWHCAVGPNDIISYIWLSITVVCSFLSLWLCWETIKMMRNANKIQRKGSKFKVDELVGRAFLVGSITSVVDFLVSICLVGWTIYPEQGFFNFVPFVIWLLFSSFGMMLPLIWGTTRELLPFMPNWIQPLLKLFQTRLSSLINLKEDSVPVVSERKDAVAISVQPEHAPVSIMSQPDLKPDSFLIHSEIPVTVKLDFKRGSSG